ncbi:MAG TPA: ribokinase [Vicinamibacterales bacterium]|nr:ribokinase [Vicinamibacterales bacterium]
MSKPPRVVVIGSCNVDLTTFTDRFPSPGETMFGSRFDLGFGGKGANQAVAARRCGAEVAMVARVGRDLFGESTVANFTSLGIDASHVRVLDGVSSGVAPIFVDSSGQNRIIVVKGANDRLMPRDVDAAAPLLDRADCLVLQFEIPLETVAYAIRVANARGVRVIVNPAPALPIDLDLLSGVNYLIPNETEAEALTGMPVRTEREAAQCARSFLDHGIECVILTLGSRGAFVASEDESSLAPAFAVTAADTTGAGDAFIGSFATFLAEGIDERECVARANLYAGLSITAVGTQKSFWSRVEFEREWARRKTLKV